jgi:PAS domain-containing protein
MGSVVGKPPAKHRGSVAAPSPRATVKAMQRDVLEAIAAGRRLDQVGDVLCRWIERLAPRAVCTIMIVDRDTFLQPLAFPSLPRSFFEMTRNLPLKSTSGTCGAAASRGVPVWTLDLEADPRWEGFRDIPRSVGLRACWSNPVHGRSGKVVGTFALYFRSRRGPSRAEAEIVLESIRLCALAIDHEAVLVRLEQANQRLDATLSNVRQGVCFFDGQQRLVMANGRYSEIYGIAPGRIKPGATLQEVVDLRIEAGAGPVMPQTDYLDWRTTVQAAESPTDTIVELVNGTVIAIHHRSPPMKT